MLVQDIHECAIDEGCTGSEAAKSDHTTLAHWQFAQARSIGVLGSSSVRISCGPI